MHQRAPTRTEGREPAGDRVVFLDPVTGPERPPRPEREPAPALTAGGGRAGERVFAALSSGAGVLIVVLVGLVAVFLVGRAIPALAQNQANFLLSSGFHVAGTALRFGVLDLLWVTGISSLIALVLAVPVAVGVAVCITQYAPVWARRPLAQTVDLLAAVPSIIFGIWGIYILAPHLEVVQRALYHLGFIPLFADRGVATGSIFDASVVLAVMILPIIAAVARDVFERTPRANIEAAWALGATRWEVVRMAVLPYGRAGVVSAAMLGLGRALGETMAVLLILSRPAANAQFSFSIFDGGQTFASLIGGNMKEANGPTQVGAYIAAGLVLFALTFAVNALARMIAARSGVRA